MIIPTEGNGTFIERTVFVINRTMFENMVRFSMTAL